MSGFFTVRLRRFCAMFCLVVAFSLAVPRSSDASWAEMYRQALLQVKEATDIWKRHTAVVEDLMDNVAGVQNAFSDINFAYKRIRSGALPGIPFSAEAPRFGDLYRAGFVNDRCFRYDSVTAFATCELRDFLSQEDVSRFRFNLRRLPRTVEGLQRYGDWEWAVREGWEDAMDVNVPSVGAGPVGSVVGQIQDIDEVYERVRVSYRGGRRRARRMAGVMQAGRRAGRQVLQDSREGTRGPLAGFGNCLTSLSEARTLLAAAYDADCRRSTASTDPRGGDEHTQNVSPNESMNLTLQAGVVHTNIMVAELEANLLIREAGLGMASEIQDMRREQFAKSVQRFEQAAGLHGEGCVSYSYVDKCLSGEVEVASPAQEQERVAYLANMHVSP